MKQGFSLIEVLFAIAFLALGLFAVLQVFPAAFNLERLNQARSQAIALAQEKMEEIYSKAYVDVAPGNFSEGLLDSPFDHFSRQTIVDLVDGSLQTTGADIGLKKITVIVNWETALPWNAKQVEVLSLIANP